MIINHLYITFLNPLGGFEYFLFRQRNEYQVDIEQAGETTKNIFPDWPRSYGAFADTIDKTTFRNGRNSIIIKSQYLTLNQVEALSFIKTSPIVELMTSRTDKIRVIVDTDSYTKYDEANRLFTIQFKIKMTNNIESQRL